MHPRRRTTARGICTHLIPLSTFTGPTDPLLSGAQPLKGGPVTTHREAVYRASATWPGTLGVQRPRRQRARAATAPSPWASGFLVVTFHLTQRLCPQSLHLLFKALSIITKDGANPGAGSLLPSESTQLGRQIRQKSSKQEHRPQRVSKSLLLSCTLLTDCKQLAFSLA